MRLLNYTFIYLSCSLLLIIGIWATVFYIDMLDEVHDSIDDGLGNYKMLIIQKAQKDSTVLFKTSFDESNYKVTEIPKEAALNALEQYTDTLMYMQNEEDYEPVRLLTTMFSAPNGKFYELKIVTSTVEEDDLIGSLLYYLFWLYGIIILSILLINHVLLRKIWQPFYQLIGQLK